MVLSMNITKKFKCMGLLVHKSLELSYSAEINIRIQAVANCMDS